MRSFFAFGLLMLHMMLGSIVGQSAFASDLSIKYGLGAENSVGIRSEQRMINIGLASTLWGNLCYHIDGGVYFDNHRDIVSGFAFAQVGPRIFPMDWFYIENVFGPGFITKTDDLLGSAFQFAIDIGIGLRDPGTELSLGISFKHISNAGIVQPNHGRNFWLVQANIPVW